VIKEIEISAGFFVVQKGGSCSVTAISNNYSVTRQQTPTTRSSLTLHINFILNASMLNEDTLPTQTKYAWTEHSEIDLQSFLTKASLKIAFQGCTRQWHNLSQFKPSMVQNDGTKPVNFISSYDDFELKTDFLSVDLGNWLCPCKGGYRGSGSDRRECWILYVSVFELGFYQVVIGILCMTYQWKKWPIKWKVSRWDG